MIKQVYRLILALIAALLTTSVVYADCPLNKLDWERVCRPTRAYLLALEPDDRRQAVRTPDDTAFLAKQDDRRPRPVVASTAVPLDVASAPPATGKSLFVDQSAQVMRVYKNDEEIRVLPISTGRLELYAYTPAWQGRVRHYVGTTCGFGAWMDHAWYLFQATGDILIHGAPYTLENGEKIYHDLDALGVRPSSHGCIRLHPDDAAWLTEWNSQGATVTITRADVQTAP